MKRVMVTLLLLSWLVSCSAPPPTSQVDPTQPVVRPQPTSAPTPARLIQQQSLTVAVSSGPAALPLLLIAQNQLLKAQAIDLKIVPLGLPPETFSPEQQIAQLRNGTWDVLLTDLGTLTRYADRQSAQITAIIGENAGGIVLAVNPELNNVAQLRDATVVFHDTPQNRLFLWQTLALAGLRADQLTLVPVAEANAAVVAFQQQRAAAVVVNPTALADSEVPSRFLLSSDQLRVVTEVIASSPVTIRQRPEVLQAFHEAWFMALRSLIDDRSPSEDQVIAWGHSDWTKVTQPGDLALVLSPLAQATLQTNTTLMLTPAALEQELAMQAQLWGRPAEQLPAIEPRFIKGLKGGFRLLPALPPVNNTFHLGTPLNLPEPTHLERFAMEPTLTLPLTRLDLSGDQLSTTARTTLEQQVLPALLFSRLYLQVATAAPTTTTTSQPYDERARQRTERLAQWLISMGAEPSRLVLAIIPEAEVTSPDQVRLTLMTLPE